MASLVGISEQWYSLLERGRARNVSAEVLLGLANAFDLSPVETEHLFALAGKPPPEGIRPDYLVVPSVLRHFLDAQLPSPAYVIDNRWDILAWNEGARVLFDDLSAIPRERRNILLLIFTEPAIRARFADWESHVKIVLAFFRRDYGRNPGDPRLREVVAELKETSEEFRAWWPLQEVDDHVPVRTAYMCPGPIRLEFERVTFISAENPNLRVVIFLPAPDTDTAEEARRLIAEQQGH